MKKLILTVFTILLLLIGAVAVACAPEDGGDQVGGTSYTVTFDLNGGTLVSGNLVQTVDGGGIAEAPDCKYKAVVDSRAKIPEYISAEFLGWYKSLDDGAPYDFEAVTADITLTAKWKIMTFKYIETKGGVVVTGLSDEKVTGLIVPDTVDGNAIVEIAEWAFKGKNQLVSAEIGNGVKRIGESAFTTCENLKELKFPENLEIIEGHAFESCRALEELHFPDSVKVIGKDAFNSCLGVKSIVTPKGLETLGLGGLIRCSSLESIRGATTEVSYYYNDYGESVEHYYYTKGNCLIENRTYYVDDDCKNEGQFCTRARGCEVAEELKFLILGNKNSVIPNDINYIYDYAFSNCTELKQITLPDSVEEIYGYAFSDCVKLESVTFPENLNIIWNYAFSNTGLVQVSLPDSLRTLYPYVFSDNSALTGVAFGSGIKNMGYGLFSGCGALENISMTNGNEKLYASGNCLISVASETVGTETVETKTLVYGTTKSIIPDDVDIIGNYAFMDRTGLHSINIPDSVTSIGMSAFQNCTGLDSINIPNSVTNIWGYAFLGCSGLTEITLPDSLQTILGHVFYGCSSLTEITLPDSVKSIGSMAFANCSSLTEITLPASLETLSGSAFSGCSDLKTINVAIDNEKYYVEGNCVIEKSTKKLVCGTGGSKIPSDITAIGTSAFSGCTDLVNVTLPDSVKSIGSMAFANCSNLTDIDLSAVESIGYSAFSGCTSLTGIKMDNVTSIADSAFSGCSSLTEIVLPSCLISLEPDAFSNCAALEKISVADGNEKYYVNGNCLIEKDTMTLIRGTGSSVISDGVLAIGASAFSGCEGLTDITIPDSVTSIGDYAFLGCVNLQSIIIPASVTEIDDLVFVACADGFTIYCEAESKPDGWSDLWNVTKYDVVWGYKA